jgi:hypothetical protein
VIELFADLNLSEEASTYIARGLRALADVDGLSNSELALVEQFEREAGIGPTSGRDFDVAGGGPLKSAKEREAFLSSLLLMSLADGRVSAREEEMIDALARELGVPSERQLELDRGARKFLLRHFAGVQVFRDQAVSIGRSLGLTPEEIAQVLG